MVFVVNTELNMGRGKQCAQVAHAAVALSVEMLTSSDELHNLMFNVWYTSGQKKIVLRGETLEEVLRILDKARTAGRPNHLVTDAGHTQIAPGSKTVLAIFGSEDELQDITGSLRLL